MEKYNIIQFKLSDKNKAFAIMTELIKSIRHNSLLFEFWGVKDFDRIQKDIPQIDLKKYEYEYYYKHMINSDWIPEEDKRVLVLSNLGEEWEDFNPYEQQSLSFDEFTALAEYFTKSKPRCYSTLMLGLDRIDWEQSTNTDYYHTYGYEKAKSSFDKGKNYLSNSIIFSKESMKSTVYLTLSFHERFKSNIQIQRIIERCGKIAKSNILYAPSNEIERAKWNSIYEDNESKFNAMIEQLPDIIKNLPYQFNKKSLFPEPVPKDTINVRKIAKETLCSDGWKMLTSKDPENWGIAFKKKVGNIENEDSELLLFIDSLHRGHYLQTLIEYKSVYFSFKEHTNYSYELKDIDGVSKYVENVKIIGDYIFRALGGKE